MICPTLTSAQDHSVALGAAVGALPFLAYLLVFKNYVALRLLLNMEIAAPDLTTLPWLESVRTAWG